MTSLVIAAVLIAQQPTTSQVASLERQREIMAAIKAEREAQGTPSKPTPVSPGDANPRAKLKARRAAYRAFNAKQQALEDARLAQAKREALMMLPFQLQAQQDMLRFEADVYRANMRYRGDKALANGFAGVSTPPY